MNAVNDIVPSYIHRPNTFLCGVSPGPDDEDPDEPPLDVDYDWFEERIWPVLAERAGCFEALKVVSLFSPTQYRYRKRGTK